MQYYTLAYSVRAKRKKKYKCNTYLAIFGIDRLRAPKTKAVTFTLLRNTAFAIMKRLPTFLLTHCIFVDFRIDFLELLR